MLNEQLEMSKLLEGVGRAGSELRPHQLLTGGDQGSIAVSPLPAGVRPPEGNVSQIVDMRCALALASCTPIGLAFSSLTRRPMALAFICQ